MNAWSEAIARVTRAMTRQAGTDMTTVSRVADALGVRFPMDYTRFLLESNGAEGPIGGDGYLILWPIERVAEAQREYEVDQRAPGLVLFGSSGGGVAYGFDREAGMGIVEVPFISLSREEIRTFGTDLLEFLINKEREGQAITAMFGEGKLPDSRKAPN